MDEENELHIEEVNDASLRAAFRRVLDELAAVGDLLDEPMPSPWDLLRTVQ